MWLRWSSDHIYLRVYLLFLALICLICSYIFCCFFFQTFPNACTLLGWDCAACAPLQCWLNTEMREAGVTAGRVLARVRKRGSVSTVSAFMHVLMFTLNESHALAPYKIQLWQLRESSALLKYLHILKFFLLSTHLHLIISKAFIGCSGSVRAGKMCRAGVPTWLRLGTTALEELFLLSFSSASKHGPQTGTEGSSGGPYFCSG